MVRESDLRTDWLSGIGATTTEDVSGLVVYWSRKAWRVTSQRDSVDGPPILFFILCKGVVWDGGLRSPMLVWFEWRKEGGSRLMGMNKIGKWF